MIFRVALASLLSVFIACNRTPQSTEAVRQGIVDHLAKNTGLDLGSMDVDVGNVTFKDKEAQATVTFKPKGSADQGMSMNYTLRAEGGKWVVVKRADSGGSTGGAQMPQGHPPVSGGGTDAGKLPEGHPPVPNPGPAK